ncbi:MAG: hypothetical protein KDC32_05740, partial [Saprospiraceae bacterium]|nr:hypothetical protein [Saprospiraceae bacterium]
LAKAQTNARAEIEAEIERLKTMREQLNDQLTQLGEKTQENWEAVKKEVNAMIDQVKMSLEKSI